jgi:crossover junction endodeoxyribonuclease RuvC
LQETHKNRIRILGIDPGTQITGVGVIEINEKGLPEPCYFGSIRTRIRDPLALRLKNIYNGLIEVIEKFKPHFIALEDIFYSENIKTAIVMGHARGVSLLAAINVGIEPSEYSPREVKLAVVGRGNASKGQVGYMVKSILQIQEEIHPADAADALAVALCHYNRLNKSSH